MRFHALACDYDGTLAHHGRVDDATVAALERVRASGRRNLLVTGRHLEDLETVFPRLDLFDRAVLENGGIIYDPATRRVRTLCEPAPHSFVAALEERGVHPLAVGRVIVATWEPHQTAVLEVIHDLGLELQMIFNKRAVMVLPTGVNKASGLRAALDELGLSRHNVVGIGDAENDHAFLAACECGVAVANALPIIKKYADRVTRGDHGDGVRELVGELLEDDLRSLGERLHRHAIVFGSDANGRAITLQPYTSPVLIAGTSGAGKSMVATSLLEQLAGRDYQFFIVDPEGDYGRMEGASVLGDVKHAPTATEVLEALHEPHRNVVANLLAVPLADRPTYFTGLMTRLFELRARTGRPHWFVVDEAHHMLPRSLDPSVLALPTEPHGILLVTVHPRSVAPAVMATVGTIVVVGSTPQETISDFAAAIGVVAPEVDPRPLPPGRGIAWLRTVRPDLPPFEIALPPPHAEHHRHVRKYAAGELGPDVSFYFRGPHGKLKLRAQNLQIFLQLAEGIDDETWCFHLAQGDYSRWFRERIKDAALAQEVERIECTTEVAAIESRRLVRVAIERRYTLPP